MAEYIEREAVLKLLASKNAPWDGYQKVSELPAADVQPVKHGRWVRDAVYVDETTGEPCLAWFCNQCGEPQMVGTNFCPNCGVKMDGET